MHSAVDWVKKSSVIDFLAQRSIKREGEQSLMKSNLF